MVAQLVLAIAMLGSGAAVSAGDTESQLLLDLRAENRDTRSQALQELRTRLERGDADAETIRGYVLTGLETDHALRMQASILADLITAEAQPHLVQALSDPQPEVRSRAAIGLGAVGSEATPALDRLVSLLRNDVDDVATAASVAISAIDVAGDTFPDFLEMARSPNAEEKHRAVRALDYFDDRVYPIVSELMPLLNDPDETQRYWLVNVVANTKTSNPAVVDTLVELLRDDPSSFVRERVAREFWEMGHNRSPVAGAANDALKHALMEDPDGSVREQCAQALASNRRQLRRNRAALQGCIKVQTGGVREACDEALRGEWR